MPRSKSATKFLNALPDDGERRLMLAVLIDAIRILSTRHGAPRQLHAYRAWLQEQAWVKAEDMQQPFSFVSICHALGLDAEYVRRCILHPPPLQQRLPRRYAACVEDTWARQRLVAHLARAVSPSRPAQHHYAPRAARQ